MNRIILITALYVFCMDYHSGQNSRGYRILSRIITRYKPKLSNMVIAAIRGEIDLDDWIWEAIKYQELVLKYQNKV